MAQKQLSETSLAETGFFNAMEMLNNAPIGIYTSTPEGRYLSVNPALAKMHGYLSPAEMVAAITDIATQIYVDPQDRESFIGILETQGEVINHVCRLRRKDGTIVWVSRNARVVRNGDGLVVAYQGFATDVSESRQTEREKEEVENLYQQMFVNAPMPYQSLDEQGNFLEVNQTFLDALGYARDELVGRNFGDFLHPEWQKHFKANFPKFKAVGEILGVEFEMVKKDGTTILVNFNGKVQRDGHGRFLRTHCVFQDVSDQKRIEEALRFKEQIIEAASAAVCACDLEGYMLSVNPCFLQTWGFSDAKQVLGRPFQEFWMVQDRLDGVLSALRREGSWSDEVKARRSDGSLFDVLVTASLVLDSVGNPTALMSTSIDITERNRAEQEREKLQGQLLHAQKMETVGILAGGLAHDFNNLLHVVRGNVELISKDESLDFQARTRLQAVTRSMDRATQLIQQLLLFSRKAESRKLRVDLNREVEEVARMLERAIPKMISLELHIEPSIWTIVGDPVQIELILLNLANNAVDAMPEGGRLTIETGNSELDEGFVRTHPGAAAGRHVCLTVSDTGCGMDETTLKHIFDPFFTTKEVGKGTGLGLPSVYGIVQAHDGYIQCYSEPGIGTAFKVYLPVEDQCGAVTANPLAETRIRGGGETILVVDDEEHIRELTQEVLESLGYMIKTAATGEEALEICKDNRKAVDLILLDLNMPGMGGCKCLEKLLRHDPQAKIVITSGYTAKGHCQDVIASGAKGFISKPFGLGELSAVVRNVLDQ